MADFATTVSGFFSSIAGNPAYLILTIGLVAVVLLAIIAIHIHKIHSQEIFVHQAWGAKWKGR